MAPFAHLVPAATLPMGVQLLFSSHKEKVVGEVQRRIAPPPEAAAGVEEGLVESSEDDDEDVGVGVEEGSGKMIVEEEEVGKGKDLVLDFFGVLVLCFLVDSDVATTIGALVGVESSVEVAASLEEVEVELVAEGMTTGATGEMMGEVEESTGLFELDEDPELVKVTVLS